MAGVLARELPRAMLRARMHTPLADTALHRDLWLLSAALTRTPRRRTTVPLCDGECLRSGETARGRDASTDVDARAVGLHALHRELPDVLDSR